MATVKIRTLRQCFPQGGGVMLPGGREFDLDTEIVKNLPDDAYAIKLDGNWMSAALLNNAKPGKRTKPKKAKRTKG